MGRLWSVLKAAWHRSVRPACKGAPIIVTRCDHAGLRGHIFNPFPLPDGRWSVLIDDDYDTERWPSYRSGFVMLFRWEFVLADHDVSRWTRT